MFQQLKLPHIKAKHKVVLKRIENEKNHYDSATNCMNVAVLYENLYVICIKDTIA